MEVGSFEKTLLHSFIREGGWRSPKGVDERLVGKIYVQIANIRRLWSVKNLTTDEQYDSLYPYSVKLL